MEPYQKSYYTLFNAATDALRAMEAQNYGQAQRFLMQPEDAQFSADPLRNICASDAQVSALCGAQNLPPNKNNIEINNLIRKREENRCFSAGTGGDRLWG